MSTKHLTIQQAAELLTVSKRTVYRLIRRGVLATVAEGIEIRVTLASIDAEFARRYPNHIRRAARSALLSR